MASKLAIGTGVVVGRNSRIPQRYQGRNAVVVGREKGTSYGKTVYLLSFGSRRATPLPVREQFLTVVS